MKKFLAMILSGMIVLSMAACSSSSSTSSSSTSTATTESTSTATTESTAWAPEETVTILVSYAAGSGTDTTARILTAYAEQYVGQSVIIENLEGGSGSIGWTRLANSNPDGYTLGFINLPNFSSSITEELGDYSIDDFAAICGHVTETSVVLVAASSPFDTIEELVEYAVAHPNELKASTNGNRASNHIGAQMFANTAGFEYSAIPYGGTSDQLLALRQGEVDFSIAKVADFAAFTSEVKVLGVFNETRIEEYPDAPTLGELGYYDLWLGSSRCIAAPAGTPDEIISFFEEAFAAVMTDAEYIAAAEAAGISTNYMDATATSALIAEQQIFAESLADIWG